MTKRDANTTEIAEILWAMFKLPSWNFVKSWESRSETVVTFGVFGGLVMILALSGVFQYKICIFFHISRKSYNSISVSFTLFKSIRCCHVVNCDLVRNNHWFHHFYRHYHRSTYKNKSNLRRNLAIYMQHRKGAKNWNKTQIIFRDALLFQYITRCGRTWSTAIIIDFNLKVRRFFYFC